MASTALTPVQRVRVLLQESLKIQTLEPMLYDLMTEKIFMANQRMDVLVRRGDFAHPSFLTMDDYATKLPDSNTQRTLGLLLHLLDVLNIPLRSIWGKPTPDSDFGAAPPNECCGGQCCSSEWWCNTLMCLSIVLIPCVCMKLDRRYKQQYEQADTGNEFNRQLMLKQHQVMMTIFEKESTPI